MTRGAWQDTRLTALVSHCCTQADAQRIMDERFPVPRYIVCDQHKSEARFVIAKLNPSITHNTNDGSGTAKLRALMHLHAAVDMSHEGRVLCFYGLACSWRAHLHRRREPASLHGASYEACRGLVNTHDGDRTAEPYHVEPAALEEQTSWEETPSRSLPCVGRLG